MNSWHDLISLSPQQLYEEGITDVLISEMGKLNGNELSNSQSNSWLVEEVRIWI